MAQATVSNTAGSRPENGSLKSKGNGQCVKPGVKAGCSSQSTQTCSPDRGAQAVELLPLVRRMAFQIREHLPAHVEVDDLVGAGTMGLLDALRKFDASKHVKLESYARHRIRGAILDSLRGLDAA